MYINYIYSHKCVIEWHNQMAVMCLCLKLLADSSKELFRWYPLAVMSDLFRWFSLSESLSSEFFDSFSLIIILMTGSLGSEESQTCFRQSLQLNRALNQKKPKKPIFNTLIAWPTMECLLWIPNQKITYKILGFFWDTTE